MALEDRVTELEVRIAYQDQVIAALDEVVREFAARVEQLEKLARDQRVDDAAAELVERPDDPPPHY
jgi:uncharacterized coiled-coil protein SlyX